MAYGGAFTTEGLHCEYLKRFNRLLSDSEWVEYIQVQAGLYYPPPPSVNAAGKLPIRKINDQAAKHLSILKREISASKEVP